MTRSPNSFRPTRRQFLKQSGTLAAGAVALGEIAPRAFAQEDHTIRLALIGCGNRGGGAVNNALSVPDSGPMTLHAMADLDAGRLAASHGALVEEHGDRIDVPEDRRFLGFDAYRQAIATLRPGDIALCTTRAYVRPVHVEYAVQQGINVFMEKPFASDPVGLQRLLRVGELADQKGVKIAAGLQCRHSPARMALIEQVRDGVLGDLHLIRANRLGGCGWLKNQGDRATDLLHQLRFGKIHLFWVGAGHMVDYLIHQIDECCWLKDGWPVSVVGMGGRVPGSTDLGQNLDVYSMEYTFADGSKAFCGFRRMNQTRNDFATYLHGTKCAAQFSGNVHAAKVHRFQDQRIDKNRIAWTPEKDAFSPWQYEWNNLIHSIRHDLPHNEARRAAYSDLATQMGRAACHTGQTVTWEEMLRSDFQFCDSTDRMTMESPAPIAPDGDGQFLVPVPGNWNEV